MILLGVITLIYQLPAFPSEGKWSIRVEAMSQIHDHHIIVERFYYRFFDVIIHQIFFFVVSYLGFLSFFYKIGQCCLIITDVIHVNKAEKGLMLVWQRPTVLFDDCDCRKYRRRRLFIETFVLVLA